MKIKIKLTPEEFISFLQIIRTANLKAIIKENIIENSVFDYWQNNKVKFYSKAVDLAEKKLKKVNLTFSLTEIQNIYFFLLETENIEDEAMFRRLVWIFDAKLKTEFSNINNPEFLSMITQ